MAMAILAVAFNTQYALPMFEPFALATLVIFFGMYGYLENLGKYGDFPTVSAFSISLPFSYLFTSTGAPTSPGFSFLPCYSALVFLLF
jgi:hypothetical protein